MKQETVAINQQGLKTKLQEQALKSYWVAEQIGVAPKTMQRWLNGESKNAKKENIDQLAKILNCDVQALIHETKNNFGTTNDQKNAAKVFFDSDLFSFVNKTSKWNFLKTIIEGLFTPNLDKKEKAQMNLSLSLSAIYQLDVVSATNYARESLILARYCNDEYLQICASYLLALAKSISGNYFEAETELKSLYFAYNKLSKSHEAAAVLNARAFNFQMWGKNDKAVIIANQAISEGQKVKNIQVECLGLICLGQVHWESSKFQKAKDYFLQSQELAQRGGFVAQVNQSKLYLADIAAGENDLTLAEKLLTEGKTAFANLELADDGLINIVSAHIERQRGNPLLAKEIYLEGLKKKVSHYSREYILAQSNLIY